MTAYQAESFTLVYYVIDNSRTTSATNGFRIMEVREVIGAFGVKLRTTRTQVGWHRNFYVAQDALKVWNKKACRMVWSENACSAAKGLDL